MSDKLIPLDNVIAQYTQFIEKHRDKMLSFFSDEFHLRLSQKVDHFISLLECKPPAKMLDLACGTGSATIELARRGYEVTGLDCTPAMLDIAREMSRKTGVRVTWILGDMRKITYEDEMDYVLLWDVIFSVCENEEEDRIILSNIARALKPKGRALFEVYNKEFAITHGIEKKYFYDKTTDRFVVDRKLHPDMMIESVKLYTHEEWKDMLEENQMKIIKMEGSRGERDPEPRRIDFIVAEKSKI